MSDLLLRTDWQMTLGERAAIEGVLSQLSPRLAIEIGTASGGSLRRIAAHSDEVHSFDLVEPATAVSELPNVTLHTGDSKLLLPEFLAQLERDRRQIDFALVDGDHAADAVRRDMEALLSSRAITRCAILIHDTANDFVREGLERVSYDAYPRVRYVDLDFIAGHLSERGTFRHELWGGLGLVLVGLNTLAESPSDSEQREFYPGREVLAAFRDRLRAADSADARRPPPEAVSRRLAWAGPIESPRVSNVHLDTDPREQADERFDPVSMHGQMIEAEHLVRYSWACQFGPGRRVLDAGCGIPYGSALLAEAGASHVVAVDRDRVAVATPPAMAPENLTLEVGDVMDLEYDDDSFDLVVCFEVIGQVPEPERLLAELHRVLRPSGLLLVSTPNRNAVVPGNPYHLSELTPPEFEAMLQERFASVRVHGQQTWIASGIVDRAQSAAGDNGALEGVDLRTIAGDPIEPVSMVALASDGEIPAHHASVSLTMDADLRRWDERWHQQREAIEQFDGTRRELGELRRQLVESEYKLWRMAMLEAHVNQLEDLLSSHEDLLSWHEALLNSRSWRLTEPLRWAKALAKRGRGRLREQHLEKIDADRSR